MLTRCVGHDILGPQSRSVHPREALLLGSLRPPRYAHSFNPECRQPSASLRVIYFPFLVRPHGSYSNIYLEMPSNSVLCCCAQDALALSQIINNMVGVCGSVRQQCPHSGRAFLGRKPLKGWQLKVSSVHALAFNEFGCLLRGDAEKLGKRTNPKLTRCHVERLDVPRQTLAVHHSVQAINLPL